MKWKYRGWKYIFQWEIHSLVCIDDDDCCCWRFFLENFKAVPRKKKRKVNCNSKWMFWELHGIRTFFCWSLLFTNEHQSFPLLFSIVVGRKKPTEKRRRKKKRKCTWWTVDWWFCSWNQIFDIVPDLQLRDQKRLLISVDFLYNNRPFGHFSHSSFGLWWINCSPCTSFMTFNIQHTARTQNRTQFIIGNLFLNAHYPLSLNITKTLRHLCKLKVRLKY